MGKYKEHCSRTFSWINTILLSFFAVFTGGFIYILFRPTEPIFFNWFTKAGIEIWLSAIRERTLFIYDFLPQWMVFSLPGALWAFAYTAIILTLWIEKNSFLKYFWFLSIPLLIFGFEILQFTGNIPGTFCMNDIIWSAIGITAGFLMVLIKWKRYHSKLSLEKR